jgi:hypothetical protein
MQRVTTYSCGVKNDIDLLTTFWYLQHATTVGGGCKGTSTSFTVSTKVLPRGFSVCNRKCFKFFSKAGQVCCAPYTIRCVSRLLYQEHED